MQDDLVYIDRKQKGYLQVAPLRTPLKRRLETIGVIWHCCSIPFFACLFLVCISLGPFAWVVVLLPYFIWWCFDLRTPTNGKAVYRVRNWVRNLIIWQWFVNYFPIEVHKLCELIPTFKQVPSGLGNEENDEQDLESPQQFVDVLLEKTGLRKRKNRKKETQGGRSCSPEEYRDISNGPRYIFGYHPHGVISMGVMGAFGTNVLRNEPFEPPAKFLAPIFYEPREKNRLFPGIGPIFPLTLNAQFGLPFYRDYLLSLGLTSASGANIRKILTNGDNSVCLVIGGAQESLLNNMVAPVSKKDHWREENFKTGTSENIETKRQIQLVLNKRKGFVKIAIELGNVCLVPTFGFGEADVYNITKPIPGSWGATFQQWLKSRFLFTLPFFSARGVFIYNFGLLPYRNPINICVGRPVYVPRDAVAKYYDENPDLQQETKDGSSNLGKIPQALIYHYHKLYVNELKSVYEENKSKYGYENVDFTIIE